MKNDKCQVGKRWGLFWFRFVICHLSLVICHWVKQIYMVADRRQNPCRDRFSLTYSFRVRGPSLGFQCEVIHPPSTTRVAPVTRTGGLRRSPHQASISR